MRDRLLQQFRRRWPALLALALLGGYWLLPISGQVTVTLGPGRETTPAWPQMRLEGTTLFVTDTVPWAYVLVTADGEAAPLAGVQVNPGGTWTWQWPLPAEAVSKGAVVAFYHDCHTGCVERGRMVVGKPGTPAPPAGLPTKLGVAFADPARDWHGRAGWDVELTYCRPGEAYWGVDALAARVQAAAREGLRVLVRVDLAPGQSLPPRGDYEALSEYVEYLARLARDARLQGVYGYIAGSGYNALDANSLASEQPVTPAWYARVFNGYGEAAPRTDNVVQAVHAANPGARVLVGPVRPWVQDQGSSGAPWLAYMDALVAALDEGARAKAAAGIALAAPDGFALQAPGRPGAPELTGHALSGEPHVDLKRTAWQGAQAGFRVYRDWLSIINRYPTTKGLPAYITSTNTFAPDDGTPPAQNYPRGWLTAALEEVDAEPQVLALCWFIDGPLGDTQWDGFSLARRLGHVAEAADEFDALLER